MFVVVNVVATVVTLAVSVLVIADPGLALPAGAEVTPGVDVYARACAARSLAVGGALLVALARGSRGALSALLWVSGLIQVADAGIHAQNGSPAAASAGVLALVAFWSLWWLRGDQPPGAS
ncbi:DUF4267 domain-containing protein [Nonomuraea sp. NPDC050790]|uniref:DUF4267 domain-containing protein n=1 Tax=Nonomuraea sp. NPDC050790 TaxID=3364371 RepID=UPI003792803E